MFITSVINPGVKSSENSCINNSVTDHFALELSDATTGASTHANASYSEFGLPTTAFAEKAPTISSQSSDYGL